MGLFVAIAKNTFQIKNINLSFMPKIIKILIFFNCLHTESLLVTQFLKPDLCAKFRKKRQRFENVC